MGAPGGRQRGCGAFNLPGLLSPGWGGGWTAGGRVPLQALVIRVCPRLWLLSTEIPGPRNPVLGEWGGWTSFAQAPEGLWDNAQRLASPGAPPHLHPWGFSLNTLCSPQALGFSSFLPRKAHPDPPPSSMHVSPTELQTPTFS